MGNKPLCGNVQGEERPPLNAISPNYNLSEDTFKSVKRQYLKYPDKFPYILSHMHEKDIKFVDQYFNCLTNEQKVLGDEFYAFHGVMHVTWKRSEDMFKANNLRVTDHMKNQAGYKVQNIYKILDWIMQQPKLVKQIFRIEEISKEGLVLVYLPYYGSQSHPIQIVIDNYLPTYNGTYVVPIPSHSTVGMLLLEKALAKLLGSYQSLRTKSCRQIFEMVVGIPIVLQNLGINDDEVSILSKFYNPLFKIATIQQQLQSRHSQYIKINAACTTNISIGIWQIEETEKFNELAKHGDIIMELIKKDRISGLFFRVGYASRLWENKTILRSTSPEDQMIKNSAKHFLALEQGDYYLHIFSQSDKIAVIANIIVYSDFEVNLLFRKENNELNEIKRAMISTIFNQRISRSIKQQEFIMECYNVRSRYVWDGYRGILCLTPLGKQAKSSIRIEILPEYRRKIKFQENGDFQMYIELYNGGKIISFIKLSDADIGSFYKITSLSNPV